MSEQGEKVLVIFAPNRAVMVNASQIEVLKNKRAIDRMTRDNGCRVVERQGKGVLKLLAATFPKISDRAILECADNKEPLDFVFYKMVLREFRRVIRTANSNGAGNKPRGVHNE